MGRPPCCEKVGIKKGPWTPEEDIILVSYIQQHGPGNWSAAPINTGLLRCSKSCRLRWTNYLRPGIKRGNFTPHEEGLIVHLQALLGNKWAAIASFLPQRTDNDIKNYWNTHLKKKLNRFQSSLDPQMASHNSTPTHHHHHHLHQLISKNDRIHGHNSPPPSSSSSSSSSSIYASSAENISRLLEKWMMGSSSMSHSDSHSHESRSDVGKDIAQTGFGNASSLMKCEPSGLVDHERVDFVHEEKAEGDDDLPFSFLEKWLMDESASQVEGDIGSVCKF